MGVRMRVWPFGRSEARADVNATDQLVSALLAYAGAKTGNPDALASAEACAALWERALGSATVSPLTAALRPMTADFLGLIGRGLAVRGEFVAAIRVADDGLRLIPASTWTVTGESDPATWRYRLDYAGPSRSVAETLPAMAVLHFRINADPRTPWRGRSPLGSASATAALASEIESAMTREARLPVGRIVPFDVTALDESTAAEFVKKIAEGGLNIVPAGGAGGMTTQRPDPARTGPAPPEAFASLRTDVGHAVMSAYGVPPTLFHPTGDGAGQREAWRRFWLGTVAPIGRAVAAELRAKLDPLAALEFGALRAADEDARSRAIARRAQALGTLIEAGVDRDRALELAGLISKDAE